MNIISELSREKVNDLHALVGLLPTSMSGEELAAYAQIFLKSFFPDLKHRAQFLDYLVRVEAQLAIMEQIGFENFQEKE